MFGNHCLWNLSKFCNDVSSVLLYLQCSIYNKFAQRTFIKNPPYARHGASGI